MAIIKCKECGKDVSDKASVCPNCGCPINVSEYDDVVKIKVSLMRGTVVFNTRQKVDILINNNIIWQGYAGEIAELKINEPTEITVKYHTNAAYLGGRCIGTVDPSKNKKYKITTYQGLFFKTKLVLQPVDYFDAN